jgi:hypothetical protein
MSSKAGKDKVQTKETKDIRDVADVVSTLIVLDRGRFIVDAGREFQQLTDAIVETNKPGTLTITIEVSPSGWKEGTARADAVRPQAEGQDQEAAARGGQDYFLRHRRQPGVLVSRTTGAGAFRCSLSGSTAPQRSLPGCSLISVTVPRICTALTGRITMAITRQEI